MLHLQPPAALTTKTRQSVVSPVSATSTEDAGFQLESKLPEFRDRQGDLLRDLSYIARGSPMAFHLFGREEEGDSDDEESDSEDAGPRHPQQPRRVALRFTRLGSLSSLYTTLERPGTSPISVSSSPKAARREPMGAAGGLERNQVDEVLPSLGNSSWDLEQLAALERLKGESELAAEGPLPTGGAATMSRSQSARRSIALLDDLLHQVEIFGSAVDEQDHPRSSDETSRFSHPRPPASDRLSLGVRTAFDVEESGNVSQHPQPVALNGAAKRVPQRKSAPASILTTIPRRISSDRTGDQTLHSAGAADFGATAFPFSDVADKSEAPLSAGLSQHEEHQEGGKFWHMVRSRSFRRSFVCESPLAVVDDAPGLREAGTGNDAKPPAVPHVRQETETTAGARPNEDAVPSILLVSQDFGEERSHSRCGSLSRRASMLFATTFRKKATSVSTVHSQLAISMPDFGNGSGPETIAKEKAKSRSSLSKLFKLKYRV
ncbi:hypothetical protein DFJ73DRAFT_835031, partial [Zopfochytrium polystomum]